MISCFVVTAGRCFTTNERDYIYLFIYFRISTVRRIL